MPNHSKKSRNMLKTCIPPMQVLFSNVVKYYDNTIINGLRDKAEQAKARRNNASKVDFPHSKHNGLPPKFDESWAVDASPFPIPKGWGDINGISKKEISLDWKERLKFYQFAKVVQYEWAKLQEENKEYRKYKLTWGGDWDGDDQYTDNTFDDLVHFQMELVTERKETESLKSELAEGKEEHD